MYLSLSHSWARHPHQGCPPLRRARRRRLVRMRRRARRLGGAEREVSRRRRSTWHSTRPLCHRRCTTKAVHAGTRKRRALVTKQGGSATARGAPGKKAASQPMAWRASASSPARLALAFVGAFALGAPAELCHLPRAVSFPRCRTCAAAVQGAARSQSALWPHPGGPSSGEPVPRVRQR